MSVLVLGAGMVTAPLFEYLNNNSISFSVVSCVQTELDKVQGHYPNVACHCLDVTDPQLPVLISQHKLTVNLLPPPLLVQVSEMCVDQCRPMLCASYVPERLFQLHQRAVDAGVLLLCECGLDPGIDHMLSMKVIDKVKAAGDQVTSFSSWCGGIPAPECSRNPLQYKFSWNPQGALRTCCRDAGYICKGQSVTVPSSQVIDSVYEVNTSSLLPDVTLEGHANTYHRHHLQAYGLHDIQHFFRGTLRYQGFCDSMKSLIQAGLFSEESLPLLRPSDLRPLSWKSLLSYLVTGSTSAENVETELLAKLDNKLSRLETIKQLGLLSDTPVNKQDSPFNTLATFLLTSLTYGPGERDMVVMQHIIQCEDRSGRQKTHTVGMVVRGDPQPGHSAMAKTVAYPIGLLIRMMLQGDIKRMGVVLPTTPDIYEPVLSALDHLGICAQFTSDSAPTSDAAHTTDTNIS